MNQTIALIKPRAFSENLSIPILYELHKAGFTLRSIKTLRLNKLQAEKFYAVHRERPFFPDLVDFMTSGPIIAVLLEKENAIEDLRALLGDTDSKQAKEGTIRNKFGLDKQQNAVHGSDSPENAEREIRFFFSESEMI